MKMKKFDVLAAVLVVVGGLNWGLVGAFKWNLVEALVGSWSAFVASAVYVLVGLAAIYQAANWRAIRTRWRERETGLRP